MCRECRTQLTFRIPNAPEVTTTASWVGPPSRFDLVAAQQFAPLTMGRLRETHTLLDIGCGSLRAGRLFLAYLQPGNYYGLEPETWVLEEGIRELVGQQFIDLRRPTFSDDRGFDLSGFDLSGFDEDCAGTDWVYPGNVTYRESTVARMAAEHGLRMQMLEWPHPSQRWALFRSVAAPEERLPRLLRPRARAAPKPPPPPTFRSGPGRVARKARQQLRG